MCLLPDFKVVESKQQEHNEKKKVVTPTWGCTARCRQLSESEIESIVALKHLFHEDMAVFREGLHNVKNCPYEHFYKREWEIPDKPKPDIPDNGEEEEEHEYMPICIQKQGHPLVCHLLGSECRSQLRILRNAIVHYPLLCKFQGQVYTCISQFKRISDIDLGIQNNDYDLLLETCGITFETMFKQTLEANEPDGDGSVQLYYTHRLGLVI